MFDHGMKVDRVGVFGESTFRPSSRYSPSHYFGNHDVWEGGQDYLENWWKMLSPKTWNLSALRKDTLGLLTRRHDFINHDSREG